MVMLMAKGKQSVGCKPLEETGGGKGGAGSS